MSEVRLRVPERDFHSESGELLVLLGIRSIYFLKTQITWSDKSTGPWAMMMFSVCQSCWSATRKICAWKGQPLLHSSTSALRWIKFVASLSFSATPPHSVTPVSLSFRLPPFILIVKLTIDSLLANANLVCVCVCVVLWKLYLNLPKFWQSSDG